MSGEDDISTGPRQRRGSGREEAKEKVGAFTSATEPWVCTKQSVRVG